MKPTKEVLPFTVILLAVHGDVNAINGILKHFEHYINRLSQKTLFDEYGNPHIHVEEETKRMLETKLITAILRFDLS
ncbi:helix-turn-helix domain-containing protein [Listeria monocytogenes]|uniref:helix-turn-helix domain-containing protein n=1 Tax=Listeria monocytogenes TaxID=1639 RepID=UPI001245BCE7|nr:helix-turn-helix domain-containing protein [Listeria monocytogenes]KAA9612734.1 helix-turn-helix domain-containing protein [Listeria monocytogenes]